MVLSPDPRTWEGSYWATNGTTLFDGREFWHWYQAGPRDVPRLGLARSGDGRTWRKEAVPILMPGPRGSWDERGVGDPYAIRAGQRYYMFFVGMDRARRQRLGVAVSDDGVTWYKLRRNPILELGGYGAFDAVGLGEPAVWASHGYYWMLFTGRDHGELRRLGLARSRNGVDWEKLAKVIPGDQPWNSKVICDPTVVVNADRVWVWFGGGDFPRQDQNIDGQIGLATLTPEPGK
jgi:predicted GH43/DUF377 family glycosyl hydrolase